MRISRYTDESTNADYKRSHVITAVLYMYIHVILVTRHVILVT